VLLVQCRLHIYSIKFKPMIFSASSSLIEGLVLYLYQQLWEIMENKGVNTSLIKNKESIRANRYHVKMELSGVSMSKKG